MLAYLFVVCVYNCCFQYVMIVCYMRANGITDEVLKDNLG